MKPASVTVGGKQDDGGTRPKFYVMRGNYSKLVHDSLARRRWWEEIPEVVDAEPQGAVSRAAGIPTAQTLHMPPDFNFMWRPGNFVNCNHAEWNKNPAAAQMINHFEVIKPLCTKHGLLRSLLVYYASVKISPWRFIPPTFIIDGGHLHSQDAHAFRRRYQEIQANATKGLFGLKPKQCAQNVWIVKPVASNQGRGIELFNTVEGVMSHIAAAGLAKHWVVQKYVERPFLINNRKFDMRIWVLVDAQLNVYLYREGYCRTSGDEYSFDLSKSFVHLTNYCLQKNSPNLGKFEEGNTLNFEQFQAYLTEKHGESKLSFREHLWPQIQECIVDSMLATRCQLNPNKRPHCFELFGYDFLLDEDFKVWLVEVNTNPYLGSQNKWHAAILPKMVDDMLALTADTVFPPPASAGFTPCGFVHPLKEGAPVENENWFDLILPASVTSPVDAIYADSKAAELSLPELLTATTRRANGARAAQDVNPFRNSASDEPLVLTTTGAEPAYTAAPASKPVATPPSPQRRVASRPSVIKPASPPRGTSPAAPSTPNTRKRPEAAATPPRAASAPRLQKPTSTPGQRSNASLRPSQSSSNHKQGAAAPAASSSKSRADRNVSARVSVPATAPSPVSAPRSMQSKASESTSEAVENLFMDACKSGDIPSGWTSARANVVRSVLTQCLSSHTLLRLPLHVGSGARPKSDVEPHRHQLQLEKVLTALSFLMSRDKSRNHMMQDSHSVLPALMSWMTATNVNEAATAVQNVIAGILVQACYCLPFRHVLPQHGADTVIAAQLAKSLPELTAASPGTAPFALSALNALSELLRPTTGARELPITKEWPTNGVVDAIAIYRGLTLMDAAESIQLIDGLWGGVPEAEDDVASNVAQCKAAAANALQYLSTNVLTWCHDSTGPPRAEWLTPELRKASTRTLQCELTARAASKATITTSPSRSRSREPSVPLAMPTDESRPEGTTVPREGRAEASTVRVASLQPGRRADNAAARRRNVSATRTSLNRAAVDSIRVYARSKVPSAALVDVDVEGEAEIEVEGG